MGVEALTRVFEYAPHDSMELLVLIALANIADPAGVCWPGHEYLGLYARIKHERNLRQYLRALERTGNVYASKVAHRNQKAMYLVATAMSAEEIEQVLTHTFELHLDDARAIAVDMVQRQRVAEAQFPLPLSELRKNKRRGGGPQKRRIARSAKEREIDRSSFTNKGGSPDPQRGIVRSTKEDQGINSVGHSTPSGRVESYPDPIMIQYDPNHDPPPPALKAANLGGGGGPSATTLYLQEVTDINIKVTEEFGDLPVDQVRALVEQKRRAGSRDGGIVIALRALQKRLQQTIIDNARPHEDAQPNRGSPMEQIEVRAYSIAPPDADELDMQWLMVYLEEGASDEEALRMLDERRTRIRAVNEEGER